MMDERLMMEDQKVRRKEARKEGLLALEQIKTFFKENDNDLNVIPPIIVKDFTLKQKAVYAHFDQKDRLTWKIIPHSEKYGSWFDQSPLEILPVTPDGQPSEEITELLSGVEKWLFKGDVMDHERVFNHFFEPEKYYNSNRSDRLYRQWLGLYFLSSDEDPWRRDILYNKGLKVHEDATIRALLLSLAFFDLPWVKAEEYLYNCTHDTDEVVFIKAFRICARIHDERAMDHLRPIVKSPSAVLKGLTDNNMYYPVGHAACNICPAQFAIIGTDNPDLAEHREAEMTQRLRRPLSVPVEHQRERLLEAINNFEQPSAPEKSPKNLGSMIRIPEGEFNYGIDSQRVANEVFDWTTCSPERKTYVDEFYIDPYPVTNAEYDKWEHEFASLSDEEKETYEHPGQKKGKLHRRNTFDDLRFKPDHPVVGIDWFDAWAYARYHGKELPTEIQWEKAAKGDTNRRYPWGNEFDPEALRYAGETYQSVPANIIEWIILLNKGTKFFPKATTSSVYAHPKGKSPYGVSDMCGNAWEFTKTSFFTEKDARIPFADFEPVELMGTREGHVVIRGGAWSSPAPLIGSSYRGYDLLTDRHTEISFRCVYNPNINRNNKM